MHTCKQTRLRWFYARMTLVLLYGGRCGECIDRSTNATFTSSQPTFEHPAPALRTAGKRPVTQQSCALAASKESRAIDRCASCSRDKMYHRMHNRRNRQQVTAVHLPHSAQFTPVPVYRTAVAQQYQHTLSPHGWCYRQQHHHTYDRAV